MQASILPQLTRQASLPAAPQPEAPLRQRLRTALSDTWHGLVRTSHNSLALLGLAALALVLIAGSRPDLVHQAESGTLQWLQNRAEQRDEAAGNVLADVAEPDAVARATAAPLANLPREQAAVSRWLARRYKVAAEPVAALVQEAFTMGPRAGLDPTLILAIVAIESRFNPFAQSTMGAQGLMQVVTRVHHEKYQAFGGGLAAFDPITNLRVGVQVLKECITRAGSVELGLRHYVGAALNETDGGYVGRVLAEQTHLKSVAHGQRVPISTALPALGATTSVAPLAASPSGQSKTLGVSATPAASPAAAAEAAVPSTLHSHQPAEPAAPAPSP
jgi:hypothetical protein